MSAGKAGAKGAQQVYVDAAQTNELKVVNQIRALYDDAVDQDHALSQSVSISESASTKDSNMHKSQMSNVSNYER
jgi:hypothetical protein